MSEVFVTAAAGWSAVLTAATCRKPAPTRANRYYQGEQSFFDMLLGLHVFVLLFERFEHGCVDLPFNVQQGHDENMVGRLQVGHLRKERHKGNKERDK